MADPANLPDLIASQAARTPAATAIYAGYDEVTYRDLDRRADSIAVALSQSGIGSGHRVGVCLGRTPDLVASLIAVLRVGAAYVPIDPDYPAERVGFLVADSKSSIVLAAHDTVGLLPADSPILSLETVSSTSAPSVRSPAGRDDLAYVIYTSGSTGKPKGVAIAHAQAIALIRWAAGVYDQDELSGVLFSTSICFDLSVFEMFVTLSLGGSLVLADNALALPSLPARDRVRLVNTVPSAMAILARNGDLPASVQTVNLAGEPLTRALADAVYASGTVRRLYNLYGPSEDTTYSTWTLVPADAESEPTIGRPLDGTRAYLLDPAGTPVSNGEIGELYLAGAGVATGYLGRPELTAEKFLTDPFVPGDRMYRTGDLASLGTDGELRFHGRIDNQVKIRGFRVELGEIDATLVRHAQVRSATVTVRDEPVRGRHLVAFVEPTSDLDERRLIEELRLLAGSRLPDYMVPSAFVVLPELPLTPNGKVDRAVLNAIEVDGPEVTGAEPVGDAQLMVAEVWQEVLGLPKVPADVDFADLGGNSLHAAAVSSRLAHATGRRLSLTDFFSSPTVAGIAASLGTSTVVSTTAPDLGVGDPGAPLSIQEEFWLAEQVDGDGSPMYVVPLHLAVDGAVDAGLLQRAFDLLPVRHSILRTAIIDEGDRLRAHVLEPAPVPLEVLDLSDLDPDEAETAARAVLLDAARRPLPLTRGRLISATLIRITDLHAELGVMVHHAAFDGWSTGLLVRDLVEVYAALVRDAEVPAYTGTSFADASRWLRAERNQHRTHLQDYWTDRLAGTPGLQAMPGPKPGGRRRGPREGGRVEVRCDHSLIAAARTCARAHRTTLFAVVLAATAVRVYRETGRRDIVLSAPVSVRRDPRAESVIGPMLETVLLRIDLGESRTFGDVVDLVAARLLEDLDNGWLESELMRKATGLGSADAQIGHVLVALQNHPGAQHEVDGLRVRYLRELDNGRAKSDVSMFWETELEGGPMLSVEYVLDRYDAADATDLADQVLRLLADGCSDPAQDIDQLAWTPPSEVQTTVLTDDQPLPVQIARQCQQRPDEIAVHCPVAGPVTYAALDRMARGVAAALTRDGLADVPVAVACRRSAQGIAALLGTWYAGAAYLPLDPAHPEQRLADTVADAGCAVVLTDGSLRADLGGVQLIDLRDLQDLQESTVSTVEPGDLAYLIYTSGSTGRPKGVQISHRALSSFISAIDAELPTAGSGSVAAATTWSFDIAGLELWLPLSRGGRVVIVSEDTAKDGIALAGQIQRDRIDVLQLTPTGWQVLLAGGWEGNDGLLALSGGEPLTPALARELLIRADQVWNLYGPTEATIWSTARRVAAADAEAASVPVGHPLANTTCLLLDHNLRPVPTGVIGEICLGGASLADGYWHREELTAERFVQPAVEGVGRVYRTGDLGRRHRDGTIECLGREDLQVKVRGVRIELGEIEAVLSQIAGVRRAAVSVADVGTPGARLIAYLVGDPGLTEDAISKAARRRLPAAMVPSRYVFLDAMPMTGNNKIDRASLPQQGAESAVGAASSAPETDLELLVAEVWTDLLAVEQVHREDDFFAIGGHSLLATRVVAALRHQLELDIPVRMLFDEPTLELFSAALEEMLLGDLDDGLTSPDDAEAAQR